MKYSKSKMYIKFLSLLICICLAVSTMSFTSFSDSYQNDEYFEDVEFITTLADKDDFPLTIDFEHDKSSVYYYSSQINDYGSPLLNCDELQFKMIFTVKNNEYVDQLSIKDHDNLVSFFERTNSFVLTSNEIKIDKYYDYEFKYNEYRYCGHFSLQSNGDYKIYLQTFYNYVEINNSNSQRNITNMSEKENNNTFDKANTAYVNRTISGKLSSSSDVDYYKYTINIELSPGYLDVMLYCPSTENYNFSVYGGKNHVILGQTSTKNVGSSQILRINLSTQTTAYTNIWIKVEKGNTSSKYNKSYYLNASAVACSPFFSQKASTIEVSDYESQDANFWNSEYLDTLTFSKSANTSMPFYTSKYEKLSMYEDDWMRQGCFIATMAMKLRALNYTMKGHDYRTGCKGLLPADPFTVMLANIDINGYTLKARKANQVIDKDLTNNSNEPIYVLLSNINKRFNSSLTKYDVSSFGAEQKRYALSSVLSNSKGGVVICLNRNGPGTHYMLIKSIKSSATKPEDYFIVLDPAATDLTSAEGVPFSKGATYSASPYGTSYTYNFSNIVSYYA